MAPVGDGGRGAAGPGRTLALVQTDPSVVVELRSIEPECRAPRTAVQQPEAARVEPAE